jgi:hypothetical protein
MKKRSKLRWLKMQLNIAFVRPKWKSGSEDSEIKRNQM